MIAKYARWLPAMIFGPVLVVGFFGFGWLLQPNVDPASNPPVHTVDIPEGLSFQQVATRIDEQGLIKNRGGFVLLAKLTMADRRIKPGEYAFHAGMRPMEILADLQEGKVILRQVTFPEGFTVAQIARRLAEQGLVEEKVFLQLAQDPDLIRTLDLDVPNLEGYLFPTTYQFAKYSQPEDMIRTMVAFTWKALTPELRERAKALDMSIHEVLTLASVIEKETGVPEERPLIAGVFHNRLKRNILLQSDPTVIYAMESFDGNLRKRDLSIDNPYNTYRFKGLPPGPIANPGAASMKAALYPAENSYLYFVSRNDGTHHFSSTLTEHNRAVDKFQRRLGGRGMS